jgi:hypothetical protein
MTAIEVTLAVRAGGQLPTREHRALEIEHPVKRQPTGEGARLSDEDRLRQVSFGEAATAGRGRRARQDRNDVGTSGGLGRPTGVSVCLLAPRSVGPRREGKEQ